MKIRIEHLLMTLPLGLALAAPAQGETIKEVVQETVQSNPDVLFFTNTRNRSDKRLRQARGGYYPTLDLDAGIGHEDSNNPTTRARDEGWSDDTRGEAGLFARQMVWDGWLTRSEVQRESANVNSSAYKVYEVAEDTGLRAVEVYLDVLRHQSLLATAKENVETHEKAMEQIRLRAERGVSRASDVAQMTGRLARAKANVLSSEGNLQDAIASYIKVVGREPINLQEAERPEPMPASLDEAIDMALENHPTLKLAEWDIEGSKAEKEAAKSTYYPRFDVEVSARSDNDLDGSIGTDREFQAMLRMRWNLFNGGRDQARVEEVAYQIEEAKDVYNGAYREVVESLKLSWVSYQTTLAQLEEFRLHVESSIEARDAYVKQFNVGQRSLLDVLDTQNEVFESQIDLTDAEYDNLFAMYRVQNGMGKLLDALQVGPPEQATPIAVEKMPDEEAKKEEG